MLRVLLLLPKVRLKLELNPVEVRFRRVTIRFPLLVLKLGQLKTSSLVLQEVLVLRKPQHLLLSLLP